MIDWLGMDKNTRDILDALDFIKERMATKDDVREIVRKEIAELLPPIVALELKPVREQLRQIDERLDSLEQHYANLKGVTKEIDDIRTEVQAIQQHLGIERKIAA
jgi:prefoldin subunit 5